MVDEKSGPRQNEDMLKDKHITYDRALYTSDKGMWTVYRITKEAVAKVPNEYIAQELIVALAERDRKK